MSEGTGRATAKSALAAQSTNWAAKLNECITRQPTGAGAGAVMGAQSARHGVSRTQGEWNCDRHLRLDNFEALNL